MKYILYLLKLLLLLMLVSSCAGDPTPMPVEPVNGLPEATDGYPWWNDSVFYEIFLRSYYDSDGDGIGDINGLIEKLDYLNDGDPGTDTDLGVTGIWLMPINPSPSYHGYDVTDYFAINREYGTMEDFQRLLDEAHQRGIRVIVDLVLNHSSKEHPLFKASKDAGSPERDWYVWEDEDPGFLGPWGQDVWHYDASGYYYGVFWEGMPDMNYRNEDVGEEMLDVARFWVEDVGVDGFRLDAARHIVEDGKVQEDTEETHTWWRAFRDHLKGIDPDVFNIGEVWTTNYAVVSYVKGDQLDSAFDFDLAGAMIKSVNSGDARSFNGAIKTSVKLFEGSQNAPFLTNHDMDRVMNQLGEDVDKAKSAATLLMTIPGVPFMYYGEEIGMLGKKPDEKIRTPMQWSDDRAAGFTTGNPWQPVNGDYEEVNVAAQMDDPDSLLSHYRNLINLRNRHAALRVGQFLPLEVEGSSIVSFVRASDNEVVIVIANLDDEAVSELSMTLEEGRLVGDYNAVVLYGDDGVPTGAVLSPPLVNDEGGFDEYQPRAEGGSLPPNSSLIIQLQPK